MRFVCRHGRKCSWFLGMVAGLLWSMPAARANSIGDLESLLSENIVTSASNGWSGLGIWFACNTTNRGQK